MSAYFEQDYTQLNSTNSSSSEQYAAASIGLKLVKFLCIATATVTALSLITLFISLMVFTLVTGNTWGGGDNNKCTRENFLSVCKYGEFCELTN